MPDRRRDRARARMARLALALMLTLSAGCVSAPAAHAAAPLRGVNVHSLWADRSPADVQRELELAAGAHADVVRVDVGWATLETAGKGRFSASYVERLDAFMAGARTRGIKVVAVLLQTPCWASSAPETLKQGCSGAWWDRGVAQYPPVDPRAYGDAARWLTSRYAGTLAALEVWNEPNLQRFWVSPAPARDYARLVKAAYAGVRAGRSGAPVLAGALAAADRDFLDALYDHGIAGNYHGISVHPYNEWRDPEDRWLPEWREYTFLPGLESIRASQLAHGDATPLWVTEFGWTTDTTSAWGVSELEQADYLARGFRLLDALPHVRASIAYELRDSGADPSELEHNFGLVRQDFTAKPAYGAVRSALQAPAGTAVAATAPRAPGRRVVARVRGRAVRVARPGHRPRHARTRSRAAR